MSTINVFFDEPKVFDLRNIRPLTRIVGLYFIFLTQTQIEYPFRKSRLIYIGMSEKKTNGIGNRLLGHYDGTSSNVGISNYLKKERLLFTYLNFEMLKQAWKYRIEDLESYFIIDFVNKYGVYPICNNRSGFEILRIDMDLSLVVDWKYFEAEEAQ
jgi:hypothetical protein